MSIRKAASCSQPLQDSWMPRGARTTLGPLTASVCATAAQQRGLGAFGLIRAARAELLAARIEHRQPARQGRRALVRLPCMLHTRGLKGEATLRREAACQRSEKT